MVKRASLSHTLRVAIEVILQKGAECNANPTRVPRADPNKSRVFITLAAPLSEREVITMARVVRLRKPQRSPLTDEDSFSRDVRLMVEQGVVAMLEAYTLKSKVVQLIQRHSEELEARGENVSEFFLEMCDMLVTGDLSRMHPDAFKVYLTVMAYKDLPEKNPLTKMDILGELTGMGDLSALGTALDQLRRGGFIDSTNQIVGYASRRSARKSESEGGGLFDRFAV